jgi:hypothetical protein
VNDGGVAVASRQCESAPKTAFEERLARTALLGKPLLARRHKSSVSNEQATSGIADGELKRNSLDFEDVDEVIRHGDRRARIKDLAALIGLNVIEEDA